MKKAFNIYFGCTYYDTVYYEESITEEEVRHDLINNGPYTTKITVKEKIDDYRK